MNDESKLERMESNFTVSHVAGQGHPLRGASRCHLHETERQGQVVSQRAHSVKVWAGWAGTRDGTQQPSEGGTSQPRGGVASSAGRCLLHPSLEPLVKSWIPTTGTAGREAPSCLAQQTQSLPVDIQKECDGGGTAAGARCQRHSNMETGSRNAS